MNIKGNQATSVLWVSIRLCDVKRLSADDAGGRSGLQIHMRLSTHEHHSSSVRCLRTNRLACLWNEPSRRARDRAG